MSSTGVLVQPDQADFKTDEAWRSVQQLYGLLTGQSDWGAPISATSYTSPTTASVTIQNQGTGKSLDIPGVFSVKSDGATVTTLNATTAYVTTLHAGAADADSLDVDTLVVNVTANVTTAFVTTANLTTANVGTLNVLDHANLGNADADTHAVIGVTTFKNAAGSATQLLVDAGNNRVIVGSGTALGSDATPNLQVVGRLYVAPESANDLALELRRSSAATVGWDVGVTSTNDLVLKDITGVETFRAGAVASTYQAKVTGAANVTASLLVGGGISAGASSAFTGGVTLTNSILTLTGGQIAFPSTQVPSADPNTQDDYEEGTWTPVLASTGATTYTTQTGIYTKIGNVVHVHCTVVINVKAVGASVQRISGLPFTVGSVPSAAAAAFWGTSATSYASVTGQFVNGTTSIDLYATPAAGAASQVAATFFQNNAQIQLSGFYFV